MNNEKTKSIIAYLFGIISAIIILVIQNTEKNTRYHAAQSFTINIAYYAIRFIYAFTPVVIPFFYPIITVLYFVAIIIGIVNAYQEKDPEIPIIGNIAMNIFKKQIEGKQ